MKKLFLLLALSLSAFAQRPALAVDAQQYTTDYNISEVNRFGQQINKEFSLTNAISCSIEFRGSLDAFYIIEGSNDLVNWLTLPVYDITVPATIITGAFQPISGTSIYSLNNVSTKFARIRVATQATTISPSEWVQISIRTTGQELRKIIKFNGDSMTAGTGSSNGENISKLVGCELRDYLIVNDAIGGQTSDQIFARQGSKPIILTVAGNQLQGGDVSTAITSISTLFLSTIADAVERSSGGTINGVQCVIIEDGSDNYVVRGVQLQFTQTLSANSVFIPNTSINYRKAINIFWVGRNDTDYTTLLDKYKKAIANLEYPKRFVVIGILPQKFETVGTTAYNKIQAFNNSLKALYPDNYVETTPPIAPEFIAVGDTQTSQDIIDAANGIFPQRYFFDNTHILLPGHKIIKNRIMVPLLKQL